MIHCFTGSPAFARKLLDRNFYISISGIVTFRAAENVRESARIVPFDRLLVETGSLVARDHLGKLSPAQREKFLAILDRAVAGCLAHRVRASYTNIAIINASNLILLGEALSRRDVFDEGVRRLDALALDIALFGVHEYSSTGYTAVDIDALHILHAHVRDPGVRDRAERLLKFFWTDVCASAFAPAGRLAGPHSRDYDYLYGMGGAAALLRRPSGCA